VWHDDIRTAAFGSPYSSSPISDAVWHPTHPSVVSASYTDGTVGLWDLATKQHGPIFSAKVCEDAIYHMTFQSDGSLLAAATTTGNVHIMRVHQHCLQSSIGLPASFDASVQREKSIQVMAEKSKSTPSRGGRRMSGNEVVTREGLEERQQEVASLFAKDLTSPYYEEDVWKHSLT